MQNPGVQLNRRRRPGEQGFTLIELLVVIAVLAILAAIVLFNVVGVTNRGSNNACDTDAKTVQTALDAYYSDHTDFGGISAGAAQDASAFQPLVGGGYMHSLPTQCASYDVNATANSGLTVKGNHKP
jgi:prepilin-type N-terminal cleavage/methylation domain-containing protein